MYKAITTNRFEKDIKLARKRGKDLNKIKKIMEILLETRIPDKPRSCHASMFLAGI